MAASFNNPDDPAGTASLRAGALSAYIARRINPRPLVLIAAGFCVSCALAFGVRTELTLAALGIILGLFALARHRSPAALAVSLLLLGLGLGCARCAYLSEQPSLQVSGQRLVGIRGVVDSLPEERSFTVGFTMRTSAINTDGRWMPLDTLVGVRLLAEAEERGNRLDEGDAVTISGVLSRDAQHAPNMPDFEVVARAPDDVGEPSMPPLTFAQRFASHGVRIIESVLSKELGPADASTMDAILLGDRTRLQPATWSAFVETSAVHLLATAGLHVGIIVWTLGLLLRTLTLPRKLSSALCILCVWIYAIMAGERPAVERAAFVASVYYAAILFERIPDLLSALALCVIATLWLNPALIADAGFQMTFVTVIGIIALMLPISDGIEAIFERYAASRRARFLKQLVDIELLSVAAQAASAPLTAFYYNLVALGAVPANMLAVPVMVLLLPTALVCVVIGWADLPAGTLAGKYLLAPLLHALVGIVQTVSSSPAATIAVSQPSWIEIALYYLILIGGSVAAHSYARTYRADRQSGGADRAADIPGLANARLLAAGAAEGERR